MDTMGGASIIKPWWASSNDDDDENVDDAEVLEGLKEMHMVDSEQTHSSPLERSTAEMAMSQGPTMAAPSRPSSRISRNNSQSSPKAGSKPSKIQIHRDEPSAQSNARPPSVKNGDPPTTFQKPKTEGRRAHIRSRSDYCAVVAGQVKASPMESTARGRPMTASTQQASITVKSDTRLDVVKQLDAIAKERKTLLKQLDALTIKENQLLSSLVHMETSHGTSTSTPHILKATPLLPKPTQDISFATPTKGATDKSTKHALPVRPRSTPPGNRNPIPSPSNRIPLADKTEESLAEFDSTPIYVAIDNNWDVSSSQTEEEVEQTPIPTKSKLPQPAAKITRVATKFHGETEASQMNGITEGSWTMTPRRSASAERQDEGHGQVTVATSTVATPDVAQGYKVPHTVERKKWDF